MNTEPLFDCPDCGRKNFTEKGLDHHRCRPAEQEPQSALVPKAIAALPVAVSGTWDAARRWRDAAAMMERGKLFSQVMLGFELMSLKSDFGIERGGDRKSNRQVGGLIWEDVLAQEVGISETTSRRLIQMAEAAKPRLKKLVELKGFDPSVTALSALPEGQRAALEKAVEKITDGLTQRDFFAELGIGKYAAGAKSEGRKPGEGGRPKTDVAAELDRRRAEAREEWQHLDHMICGGYCASFVLLPDAEIEAQIGTLELAIRSRRKWLTTKPEDRDGGLARDCERVFRPGGPTSLTQKVYDLAAPVRGGEDITGILGGSR